MIKSSISDQIYFIFLDRETNQYYCKSAFAFNHTDYIQNQSKMTLLQKIKITDDTQQVLFIKDGYIPDEPFR